MLRHLVKGLLLCLIGWSPAAHAQVANYEGGSIYDPDPPAQQATRNPLLEALIVARQNGRMRYVREYSENDLLRRLSRPVGRLAMAIETRRGRQIGFCTVSLIAEDLILTNHHCVVDNPRGEVVDALLWMGYLKARQRRGLRRYGVDLDPVEADAELDYAIHRVRGRPGKAWGKVRLAALDPGDRRSLFIVHHPGGAAKHISLGGCQSGAPAIDGHDLLHHCDTLGGSSGAPVFDQETRRVIGLHFSAVEPGVVNAAKRIASLAEKSPIIARILQDAEERDLLEQKDKPSLDLAERVWNNIEDSESASVLEAFIRRFSSSIYAEFAKARLKELRSEAESRVAVGTFSDTASPQPSADEPGGQNAGPPEETSSAADSGGPVVLPAGRAAEIVEGIKPAVVSISVQKPDKEGSQNTTSKSQASGFLISNDGYLVAGHVAIENATEINVEFEDGTTKPAKVIGSDAATGIALLKVDSDQPLAFLRFAGSLPPVGEHLLALGNPFGLGGSATLGSLTRLKKKVSADASLSNVPSYIHTDAQISAGHDGGPLVNADGEVIGVLVGRFEQPEPANNSLADLPEDHPLKEFLKNVPDEQGRQDGGSQTPGTIQADPSSRDRGVALPADIVTAVIAQLTSRGELSGLPKLVRAIEAAREPVAGPPRHMLRPLDPSVVAHARSAEVTIFAKSAATSGDGAPLDTDSLPDDHPLKEFFKRFSKQGGQGEGAARRTPQIRGRGMLISPEGHIATNHHVIKDTQSLTVETSDGRLLTAAVIGSDPRTDLALLKVSDAQPFEFVELAAARPVRAGDQVFVFRGGKKAEVGIVSGVGRDIGSGPYGFIQHDVKTHRSDSGSGVFNEYGQFVGLNTAIFTPTDERTSITFAVTAKLARDILGQLRQAGEVQRGWLGVHIQSIDDDIAASVGLAEPRGALVSKVTTGGPAARRGVEPGDAILSVDGKAVEDSRDLARKIADYRPGARVRLGLRRDGIDKEISVELGRFPSAAEVAAIQSKTDQSEADTLTAYRKKADGGDASAMFQLGLKYDTGDGVPEDNAEAARWYRKAMEKGHVSATYNLALLYDNGKGVPDNASKAPELYEKAAAKGNVYAMGNLAVMYDEGDDGVARDTAKAAAHLINAARGKVDGAPAKAVQSFLDEPNRWHAETRKAVQRLLQKEGHYSGAIDGVIGPGSKAAFTKWRESEPSAGSATGTRLLGMTLSAHSSGQGILIDEVDGGSDAAEKFKKGDIILEANGERISTPEDFRARAQAAKAQGRTAILLRMQSGDQQRFVALPITDQ